MFFTIFFVNLERNTVLSPKQQSITVLDRQQYSCTTLGQYKSNWLLETLKFTGQTEKIFEGVNRNGMNYHNSEVLVLKCYERLVSVLVYLNPKFQEKSGES